MSKLMDPLTDMRNDCEVPKVLTLGLIKLLCCQGFFGNRPHRSNRAGNDARADSQKHQHKKQNAVKTRERVTRGPTIEDPHQTT